MAPQPASSTAMASTTNLLFSAKSTSAESFLVWRIQDRLQLPQLPPLIVVLPLTKEQHALALLVADELQARSFCTDVLLEGDSLKSMMRHANKMGAKFASLIGPDEQAQKKVKVKNMMTGEEEKVGQKELVTHLLR